MCRDLAAGLLHTQWGSELPSEPQCPIIKYEEVYLRAYASVPEAQASIGRYIDAFYNARRPHASLDRRTPDEAYFTALRPIPVAA
jgi:transposase InsO family protein